MARTGRILGGGDDAEAAAQGTGETIDDPRETAVSVAGVRHFLEKRL